jgi:hypothetical protein
MKVELLCNVVFASWVLDCDDLCIMLKKDVIVKYALKYGLHFRFGNNV